MKIFNIMTTLALSLNVLSIPLMAQEKNEPYPYTIRIYRGNHGHFINDPDAEYIEFECNYGDELPAYNAQDLIAANSDNEKPYKPATIKMSGEDLLETENLYLGGTKVTSDQDYVVTYNLLLDPVEYTINYMDVQTRQPIQGSTPSVYTGNIGEQIVLSFPYFEGYMPQARNARFDLTEDGSHNFNFWYEPVEEPATIPGNTTTITDTETEVVTTPGTTTTTPPATTPAATPGADATTPTTPTTPEPDDTTTPGGDEPETPDTPQDIVDIEDDNTPLAGPDENKDQDASKSSVSMPLMIGLGALAIVILGGIIYFVVKKKKEKK